MDPTKTVQSFVKIQPKKKQNAKQPIVFIIKNVTKFYFNVSLLQWLDTYIINTTFGRNEVNLI